MKIKKNILAALIILIAVAMCGIVMAGQGKGPARINIYGGKTGNIDFPHKAHQDSLKDCSICHTLFKKEENSLKKMKEAGDIKKKAVMNKLCIKCHRAKKSEGVHTGPTSCRKCHIKG